jgi:hypothetical protein
VLLYFQTAVGITEGGTSHTTVDDTDLVASAIRRSLGLETTG